MDVNFIRYLFIINLSLITICECLIRYLGAYAPSFLTRTFYYGKCAVDSHHAIIEKSEVPKRWFKHFYIFAAPAFIYSFILISYKYFYDGNIPEIVYYLLDIFLGKSRSALVSSESTILATILFAIHCSKRLYESQYVNVFSNKKINISHYITGYLHYFGLLISIIGESEGFVTDTSIVLQRHRLTFLQIICAIIFIWSTLVQLNSNIILANLRKNSSDAIISYEYKIPHGGLFEYISGPLHLTEIVLYLMLSIILWQASTYHYVTIWVIINQMECALWTHLWYQKTFKNYPKHRKMIIPYIL